jgi:hypothetical protein
MSDHEHHGTVKVRIHKVDVRDEEIAPEIPGFFYGAGGI